MLDVGALVGGTVRRAGDRLRVTAQLVSTADGKVLWDSVYESRSGDVFAVQDEVTRAVVAALTPALGDRGAGDATSAAPDGRGTTDAEAYELYLKGRYYFLERGRGQRRALHRVLPAGGRAGSGVRPRPRRAGAGLQRPADLRRRPDRLGHGAARGERRARGGARLHARRRTVRARPGCRAPAAVPRRGGALPRGARPRAVERRAGIRRSACFLLSLGRTDEALVERRLATQLDPLAKSAGTAYALALIVARRFPEAEAASRRVLASTPRSPLASGISGSPRRSAGSRTARCAPSSAACRCTPRIPGRCSALVFAYAAAGRWVDAERVRAQLRRPGGDPSGGVDGRVRGAGLRRPRAARPSC